MRSSIISAYQEVYNGGLTATWKAISNESVVRTIQACVSPFFQISSPLGALNSRSAVYSQTFFSIFFPILAPFKFKGNFFKLQLIFNNISDACVTGAVIADLTGEKSAGQFYIIGRIVQIILDKHFNQAMANPLWEQVDATVNVMSGILFALQGKLDAFGAYRVAQNFPVFMSIQEYFIDKKS